MSAARRKRVNQKTCRRCGDTKPIEAFVKDGSGWFPWCKTCHVFAQAQYRKVVVIGDASDERVCGWCGVSISGSHANRRYCSAKCKDKAKRVEMFGLSPIEYKALETQNAGRCPICRRAVKKWALDHNHDTGETMGLVCVGCNIGLLAYSNHRIEWALGLVAFLENPPVREMVGERRYVGPSAASQLHRRWGWTGEVGETQP